MVKSREFSMQATTRIKLTLRKYLPAQAVDAVRILASCTVLRLPSLLFRVRTLGFKKRMVKDVTFAEGKTFKIVIDPQNGYLDEQIYAKPLYEPHIVHEFVNNIKEGDTCIDVGANIGHHAIIMAKCAGPGGKVYAFEPIPAMQEQMGESIRLNKLENITVVPDALSDDGGELILHINEGTIASSSFVADTGGSAIKVPVRTLDSYGYGKVDFMKVDVEGFEYKVFLGARKVIAENHPKILFEYSPIYYRKYSPSDTFDILALLKEEGYVLLDLEDAKKEITDIRAYADGFAEGLRTQTNILAL
jgi:FkbM family methyltransferase